MKKYILIILILVISFKGNLFQQSEISTKLWENYFLGEIKQIEMPFTNEKNKIITSSEEGIISKIDLSQSKIEYRKFMKGKNIDVSSNEKNILVMDETEPNFLNIFNSHTGQFISNLENTFMFENQTLFTPIAQAVSLKKGKNLNIYLSQKKIQIFNNNQMLFDSKTKEDVIYFDYYINENSEKIYYILKDENNDFSIYEIPTVNIARSQGSLFKKIDNLKYDEKIQKIILSHSKIFIFTKEKQIKIFDYLNQLPSKVIDSNFELEKSKFLLLKDEDVVIINEENKKKLNIITSSNEKLEVIANNQICEISKDDKKLYCFETVSNENEIKVKIYNLPLTSSNSPSETFNIKVNSIMEIAKAAAISNNLIILATNKCIYEYDISKSKNPLNIFTNNLAKIEFSELITFSDEDIDSNDQIGKNSKNRYTSISNLKQNGLVDVLNNLFNSFIQDLIEIGLKLKNLLVNIIDALKNLKTIDPNAITEIKTISEQVKFSYFLYTKNNELFVFDAEIGKIKFMKRFTDNRKLIKIKKYDENINVLREPNSLYVELIFVNYETKKNYVYIYDLIKDEMKENLEYNNKYLYVERIKECQNKLINEQLTFINLSLEFKKDKIDFPFDQLVDKMLIEQIGNNTIYAFKLSKDDKNNLILSIAYNLKFDEIISYSLPKINSNSNPTYLVGEKIYYKFMDEDLMIILSRVQPKNLLINIVKGESGKILYETIINNLDMKSISFAFQDNWGIISYIKKEKGFRRNEVFSFELMKQEIENSLINLLQKHFKTSPDNSLQKNIIENDISILTYTFALERHIKQIYVSKSEMNKANQFIAAVLENNKIFLVDRRTFSPRRPKMKDIKGKLTFDPLINSIYADQDLPPYQPLILFDHKYVLDAEIRFDQIDNVDITPTESESTFMLCTTGTDIKCYKVYPDKVYDSFNKKFLSYLILLFSFSCMVCIYFLRKYTKKAEFKNVFVNL